MARLFWPVSFIVLLNFFFLSYIYIPVIYRWCFSGFRIQDSGLDISLGLEVKLVLNCLVTGLREDLGYIIVGWMEILQ